MTQSRHDFTKGRLENKTNNVQHVSCLVQRYSTWRRLLGARLNSRLLAIFPRGKNISLHHLEAFHHPPLDKRSMNKSGVCLIKYSRKIIHNLKIVAAFVDWGIDRIIEMLWWMNFALMVYRKIVFIGSTMKIALYKTLSTLINTLCFVPLKTLCFDQKKIPLFAMWHNQQCAMITSEWILFLSQREWMTPYSQHQMESLQLVFSLAQNTRLAHAFTAQSSIYRSL